MAEFTAERLTPDVWVIRGRGCDSYLLPGTSEAMMIDAGMSTGDIRAFAEQTCGMPVRRVVNTHSHFDHTAGNGFFEVVYATSGIARSAKNTMGGDPAKYPMGYGFTIVRDGDVIDAGGRPLEVIELDCHSPGNIALLDRKGRALFPGDEVDTGQVLLLPGYAERMGQVHARHAASVETYLRALDKLKARAGDFDRIFPAHNGAPIGVEWLDAFRELARRVLDGHEGSRDCSGRGYGPEAGHFPRAEANYRRATWQGASLVYCADLLWDRDYAKGQAEPATELHRKSAGSAY